MKGLILPRFFLGLAAAVLVLNSAGCDELSGRRYIQDGNKLYGQGKYVEAIEKFEAAIEKAPQLAIAHHNCGLAHLKMFETGEPGPETDAHAKAALARFHKYLETNPGDEKIVSAMVKLHVDSGDYEGAIAYWESVLKTEPKNMKALTELASINEKALRFEDALGWHRKRVVAAESSEEKVNALSSIGMLEFRRLLEDKELFGAKRLAMADIGIAAFQGAIELQPENEHLYALMDVLYQQRGWATDVSYARAVESTSALVHRLQWRDLFTAKQKRSKEEAERAASRAPDEAER